MADKDTIIIRDFPGAGMETRILKRIGDQTNAPVFAHVKGANFSINLEESHLVHILGKIRKLKEADAPKAAAETAAA